MTNIINITDTSFNNDVLKSDIPVLLDFWAVWCAPCKAMGENLEEVALELEKLGNHNKIKIAKLNVDENPNTASTFGIRSIPTILIFKNGNILKTIVGLKSKSEILTIINEII